MATREQQKIAGRYALGRLIDSARTGEVYEARDTHLEREVAVKILTSCDANDPATRRAIEASAHRAARLLHPNIVTVYDGGVADGTAFVVLERRKDATLDRVLQSAPLPGTDVRRLGLDLLAALEAAHDAGIVHGDITPTQVVHATDGRWKLGGFGEPAHVPALDRADGSTPRTSKGRTPADDVRATGLVLFTAATGLASPLPSSAGGSETTNGDPQRPLRALPLRPDLNPALGDLIDRATGADPSRPFSSARDMSETLRSAGAARGPTSAPVVELAPRTAAGPRAAVGTAAVVDLTAAERVAAEATSPMPVRTLEGSTAPTDPAAPDFVIMPPPPDGETTPSRIGSRRKPLAILLAVLVGGAFAAAAIFLGQGGEDTGSVQAAAPQGSELSAATIDVGEGRGGVSNPVDPTRETDNDRSRQNQGPRNDGGKGRNDNKGSNRGDGGGANGGGTADGANSGATTGTGTSTGTGTGGGSGGGSGGGDSGGSGGGSGGGDSTGTGTGAQPGDQDPPNTDPGGDNTDPGGGGETPPGA